VDTKINSIDRVKQCLKEKKNFVLQGGAGSGKTEALKEILEYLSKDHPNKKIVCITHTNLAVDEIKSRVGEQCAISTIHSFLHDVIKDYKINIKSVISELFIMPLMQKELFTEGMDDKEYKKNEHKKYKKLYEKYVDTAYSINKKKSEKCVGKRDYDKSPEVYNEMLNKMILELNIDIIDTLNKSDYFNIEYNNTKFDSFRDVSYGHDGLLILAGLLMKKYPLLNKIISDKYDYIFIDEYQDTNPDVIECLIEITKVFSKLTLGLFGDTMQAIYPDGVGEVSEYIKNGVFEFIPKPDNYRCSVEVLDFINTLRLDEIKQEAAFKRKEDGTLENIDDRHGSVEILYSLYENKPNSFSSIAEKEKYLLQVDNVINSAMKKYKNVKVLLLTNKAIAQKVGFSNLYKIFDERYSEVNDRMEEYLNRIQVLDLCEMCYWFEVKNYNEIIRFIKNQGFLIRNVDDKVRLVEYINIIRNGNLSLNEALKFAFDNSLLKSSESFIHCVQRNKQFLSIIKQDEEYCKFKEIYEKGENTFTKQSKIQENLTEEEFKSLERQYKKERFIHAIDSDEAKFEDAFNYFKYINEESNYITMHKTKGSSIENVIVVMEEYFWNSEYNFDLLFKGNLEKQEMQYKSQKLIYVACSRAKNNLICLKLLDPQDKEQFLIKFPNAVEISVE
jgi:DNA helicase-2/ATP-dependent DNA helicase PcrA